jgi:WD40 repeat protein
VSRRIFLSYARGDAEPIAARLEQDLRALGHEAWRDRAQLVAGASWEDQCSAAIRDAEVVVALLSPLSVRNQTAGGPASDDSMCRRELARALEARIPVVPVLVAPCEIPLTLCGLHYQDLTGWHLQKTLSATAVEELSRHIEAAASGKVRRREGRLPRMLDFTAFLNDRRRGFTGRRWLFDKLEELLTGDARAVLITGDPGIGKSAIVAELVHTNPGNRVLAYHCCQWTRRRDTLDASRFVEHLAGMLAARIEEYAAMLVEELRADPLPTDEPMTAFERAILGPLSRLTSPPEAPRYILIDALDEALSGDGETATTGIVQLLAHYQPQLPDWLRIVATSRGEREVLVRLDALNSVELRATNEDNRQDVADYIHRRLITPPLSERVAAGVPDAETKLVDAAEGNFLVARTVLDALRTGALPFDQLGRLAPGLGGVYMTFFERLFPTPASYEHAALVLGAAVTAEEPLDDAQLAAVTRLDARNDLREAIDRLAAFLPVRRDRHGRDTYTLFHKSLADWLTRVDERKRRIAGRFHIVKADFHRRFADIGWAEYQRGPEGMSRYALLNLPNHLFRAGSGRELAQKNVGLLLDGRYLTARVAAEGASLASLYIDYQDAEVGWPGDVDSDKQSALEIVAHALRLSGHAVTLDRRQFASQLAGRLLSFDQPEVRKTVAGAIASARGTWLRPLTPSLVPAGGTLRWIFRGRPAGHKGTVRSIALSTDGMLALTAGNSHPDQTVKLWDLWLGQLRWSWPEAAAAGGWTALALLPELAVASHGNTLQVWSIATGARLHVFDAHADRITALAVAEGRLLVSAAADGTVGLWDATRLPGDPRHIATGATVDRLAILDGKRLLVTHSETAGAAAYSLDTLARVHDVEAEATFAPLAGNWPGYGRPTRPIALDPTGGYAVTAHEGGALEVWSVKQRMVWAGLRPQGSEVSAAAVSPDGRTAVSSHHDHDLKVWDLTQYEARPSRPYRGHIDSIVLLPDEDLVIVDHRALPGAEAQVVVWNVAEDPPTEADPADLFEDRIAEARDEALAAQAAHLADVARAIASRGEPPAMHLVAATPDAKTALFTTAPRRKSSDTEKHWLLQVWDVATHAVVTTLRGHHGMVFSAAISDDGRTVASAAEDATVKLWRLPEGACVATFTGDSEMYALAMSPDGTLVAAGERGGSIHLLRVS